MPGDGEVVIYFESAQAAVFAEQALAGNGFSVRVMPAPASIKPGCGFCLRFDAHDVEAAVLFLAQNGLDVTEVYAWNELEHAYAKKTLPEVKQE
ncbi:MAG: DUF3343 domain-containing protein [Spirochaetaceae bacterium]|jgi:hypothetical protein|nr:DUF3343 domain-containing protein [Spirochaetaceae bacterium]